MGSTNFPIAEVLLSGADLLVELKSFLGVKKSWFVSDCDVTPFLFFLPIYFAQDVLSLRTLFFSVFLLPFPSALGGQGRRFVPGPRSNNRTGINISPLHSSSAIYFRLGGEGGSRHIRSASVGRRSAVTPSPPKDAGKKGVKKEG